MLVLVILTSLHKELKGRQNRFTLLKTILTSFTLSSGGIKQCCRASLIQTEYLHQASYHSSFQPSHCCYLKFHHHLFHLAVFENFIDQIMSEASSISSLNFWTCSRKECKRREGWIWFQELSHKWSNSHTAQLNRSSIFKRDIII